MSVDPRIAIGGVALVIGMLLTVLLAAYRALPEPAEYLRRPLRPASQNARPKRMTRMNRAWAFADSVLLQDPHGIRARDEHFSLMVLDARRKGVQLSPEDQALIFAVWQRSWHLAFEQGRLAERRDG